MESIDQTDPLVQIPFENWPEIRDSFKSRWPRGVPAYYALDTQIQHPALVAAHNVQLFCPFGNFEDGIVMFNNKGYMNEVIILTNNDNTEKLEQSLRTTKRIDWSTKKCVPWADTHIADIMKRLKTEIHLKEIESGSTIKHFLSKDRAEPFENLQCPPNTYMEPLKLQNIEQVNSVWPHRYETSANFFENLVKSNLSYSLFSKETDALLAWVLLNEVGFITHLYCEADHRKKGYAEFVIKYVINDQLSQGRDLFCYILDDNIKSLNLFKKFNFEQIGRGDWMMFIKESE